MTYPFRYLTFGSQGAGFIPAPTIGTTQLSLRHSGGFAVMLRRLASCSGGGLQRRWSPYRLEYW